MSKFKVGDKVRVRKDLEVGRKYNGGCSFVSLMVRYKGKIVTIADAHMCCGENRYLINEIEGFRFTDDILEPFEEPQELKLEYNRNLNVYFLTDGVKTYCFGEYGVTSKHPNDEYCKEIGQALAYKRFMGVR